jgi:hypothetical protein
MINTTMKTMGLISFKNYLQRFDNCDVAEKYFFELFGYTLKQILADIDYNIEVIERAIKDNCTDISETTCVAVVVNNLSQWFSWTPSPRYDGRMEWLCEHGVGHGQHIHGCDGCCSNEYYPGGRYNVRWKKTEKRSG